jgi:electron transfer flavoprotein beta subunit
MTGRKKEIKVIQSKDLNVDINNRLQILEVSEPKVKTGGVIVDSVEDLVHRLKNEAKVL